MPSPSYINTSVSVLHHSGLYIPTSRVKTVSVPVHLAFIMLSGGEIYVTDLTFMCVCSKGLARIAMAALTCAVHLMAVA
jgi:hypothetical protein